MKLDCPVGRMAVAKPREYRHGLDPVRDVETLKAFTPLPPAHFIALSNRRDTPWLWHDYAGLLSP